MKKRGFSNPRIQSELYIFFIIVIQEYYRVFFTVAIVSWAREGELLALQWKDYSGNGINVYKNCIKVNKEINPNGFEIEFVKLEYSNA